MSTLKVDNIRHNNATSDAITMASDGTCSANMTSVNGGPFSNRNIIINGDFQIAQRSSLDTAVTATTDSQYLSVDRFRWRTYGGAGRASFTQVSGDYPSSEFRYSLKAICTTVNSTEDQYDQAIGYHVEGYDMQRLGWGRANPKNCTLSFWAKTSVAGTYCVSFRQGAATRSQIKEYTLSANTWTKVKLTVTGDSDSTWLNSNYTTNGKGILIEWNLGKSNSKNTSTVNSWISGNKVASNNQVRWIATLGATFSLTGVQLEVGDTATSFEHRSYGEELQRCQRYFFRLRPDSSYAAYGVGGAYSSTQAVAQVHFPVPLRASPSFSYNGSLNQFYDVVGGFSSFSAMTVHQIMGSVSTGYTSVKVNVVGSGTAGNTFMLATLNNTTTYLDFNSEL